MTCCSDRKSLLNLEWDSLNLSDPDNLLTALQQLRQEVYQKGQEIFSQWRPLIRRKEFLISGLNLAYYLVLRQRDLRPLQMALMPWGLSSLGRSESRVLASLDAVISTLAAVCQGNTTSLPSRPPLRDFFRGDRILSHQVTAVFGKTPNQRQVRIMVTLPTEAATDGELVRDLVKRGMDCARINCSHDTPDAWEAMIGHLRQAEQETGNSCKVFMDLGGPKPRTGRAIAPDPQARIFTGDKILLTRSQPLTPNPSLPSCQISCTLPEVIDQLQIGASVWIDDGHLGARVTERIPEGVILQVTQARPKGEKLRPDKGLNFPDTTLRLSPLTDKDLKDLDLIVNHADLIGYSFVQEAADITRLQKELQIRLGDRSRKLAIIAKIETPTAVSNLPDLIVHAAGQHPFGVMIARGDLAVEIGYQRLAEIQEEILWLCEAANVPVIWATQVLDNLVKKGIPSRAEMTDAAMAERAECVMLNKGPFILEAVTILDDVLTRMQAHQSKKTPQLRALHSWDSQKWL